MAQQSGTLDIRNFTRRKRPGLPFAEAANAVLPGWDISLVFAGTQRAQQLNVALRAKDYIPNVLSYEVGKKSGEIIICPIVADKQAPGYDLTPRQFILYLFIHGLYHLKGLRHGATMEKHERALLARLSSSTFSSPSPTSNGTTHRNRNRYRNTSNESRRRRGS